jgi:hypothetical protein
MPGLLLHFRKMDPIGPVPASGIKQTLPIREPKEVETSPQLLYGYVKICK